MTTQLCIHRVVHVTSKMRRFDWGATLELAITSRDRSGDETTVEVTLFCEDQTDLARRIHDAIQDVNVDVAA